MEEAEFRNIFAHNVAQKYPDADLARLVLKVPEALMLPMEESNEQKFIEKLTEQYKQYSVSDLYQLSKDTPFRPVNDEVLKSAVKGKKIIYFFIPGIVGEILTDNAVFTEILRNEKSSFAQEARQYYKNYKKQNGKRLKDPVFRMRSNEVVEENLEELLLASSIDDEDGEALVKFVYFFPQFLSLETFGPTADRAAIAIRRIEKFIKLVETNEGKDYDFIIIGYSQGSPVAMEVSAQLQAANSPLLKKLKAVVSYSGTVWGSELADIVLADAPKKDIPPLGRQFKAFEELINNLETEAKNPLNFFKGYYQNKKNILAFIKDVMSETEEGIKTSAPKASIVSLMKLVMRLALVEFKALDLGVFHYQNMKKLKKFGTAVIAGVNELTTEYMENWHREHILPSNNIRYYNISGVSGDIEIDKEFFQDSLAGMDLESLDFEMLQGQFQIIQKGSGLALNDSQLSMQRTRFWPELSMVLNPKQPKYDATFLGVLGTHHWGITFDYFNASAPQVINNFKRPELILSLAEIIAADLAGITAEEIYK